jgi:hypothetical protein
MHLEHCSTRGKGPRVRRPRELRSDFARHVGGPPRRLGGRTRPARIALVQVEAVRSITRGGAPTLPRPPRSRSARNQVVSLRSSADILHTDVSVVTRDATAWSARYHGRVARKLRARNGTSPRRRPRKSNSMELEATSGADQKGWTDVRKALPRVAAHRARGLRGADDRRVHQGQRRHRGQGDDHRDCPPLKTDQRWQDAGAVEQDVRTFEAANPGVKIITISVGRQCKNPPDFTARCRAAPRPTSSTAT